MPRQRRPVCQSHPASSSSRSATTVHKDTFSIESVSLTVNASLCADGFNNVGYPHGPYDYANPEARTPTMDKLAMDGVRLERHYVCELAIVTIPVPSSS